MPTKKKAAPKKRTPFRVKRMARWVAVDARGSMCAGVIGETRGDCAFQIANNTRVPHRWRAVKVTITTTITEAKCPTL